MRSFVRMKERPVADAQERVAMLAHRLTAIDYHYKLQSDGSTHYSFFIDQGDEAVMMYDVESSERTDWLIKRDPYFAYTATTVTPVISTEALVREAQDYLGEEIFRADDLSRLNFPRREIDLDGEYWLAWKEVLPFSPLLPVRDQDDIHRRTILAQQGHFDNLEFADDNPVGRPVGILIANANLTNIKQHVESCAVYPDTVVTYTRLLTLRQAWMHTRSQLQELRRTISVLTPEWVGEDRKGEQK